MAKLFQKRDSATDERTYTTSEAAEIEAREAEKVEAAEARPEPAYRTRRDAEVEERPAYGIPAARERFGGIDLPASLIGTLTALALTTLLAGIVGATIGAIGYQTGLSGENIEDITVASMIGGLVVLFLAYLIGGYAAGRMARYDGPKNGFMTGIWTILLAGIASALAAGFGDKYDVFRNVDMPQWFSQDALTTGAIISGIVAVAVMLIAGLIGGTAGESYHRRADRTITGERPGRKPL